MPVQLADVLAHPVVRRGDPVVLAGADRLDRPIRWVHSSDICEIAPLLRDGDMLLTTGLGLRGCGEQERRAYVRQLADRGVAGFVLELCRFFTAAPPDMVDEAERRALPMVGFRALVPFVEVTEAVNATIVDTAVSRLRRVDEVSRGLSEVLAADGGPHSCAPGSPRSSAPRSRWSVRSGRSPPNPTATSRTARGGGAPATGRPSWRTGCPTAPRSWSTGRCGGGCGPGTADRTA